MSGVTFDLTINIPTILAGIAALYTTVKLVAGAVENLRGLGTRIARIEKHLKIGPWDE